MEIFTTRWHLHQTFLVCWVSFWKIFIQGSPAFVFTFRLRSKLFSVTVLNWIQPFPFKLLIWAPSEDKYFSMWLRFRKGPLLSFFLWNGMVNLGKFPTLNSDFELWIPVLSNISNSNSWPNDQEGYISRILEVLDG